MYCRCRVFGVRPLSFFTVPRKTFHPFLNDFVSVASSRIQSEVLFDIILMSSYAVCLWARRLCGIESLHLPGHRMMAAVLRKMIKMDTMYIYIPYSKGLSNQNFVCNSFFFLLCSSSATLSLPDLFTKTSLKIYLGYHTVYYQLQ